ncbi:type I-E CRISPR-associated protein Cse2/CasB [Streptomyces sp. NPDC051907]|uniref:type I-E CRISPR-associated protein Cse2/CasB n=1 Tax=Streptomyces sp. NPDC051907 TaxID=3155284 RepID=UPI0034339744
MSTVTAFVSPREQVARLAAQHIADLQRGYLADQSHAVGALARLRRGAGREAGQLPDLWSLVDTGPLHEPAGGARAMAESELACAEDALHVALTLWALHQQSRTAGMHQADRPDRRRGLGAAVRRMMKPGEIDEPLRKRLVRAGAAADLTALAQRLRDIVLLLRREGYELDYALLAGQLYTWQRPGGPGAVRREWGRSFHAWREPDTGRQPAGAPPADGDDTARPSDTDKDPS